MLIETAVAVVLADAGMDYDDCARAAREEVERGVLERAMTCAVVVDDDVETCAMRRRMLDEIAGLHLLAALKRCELLRESEPPEDGEEALCLANSWHPWPAGRSNRE